MKITFFFKQLNIELFCRFLLLPYFPYLVAHSYNPDDIIYNTLPLYHSNGGCIGVGACLFNGNTVALRRKFSASRFWADCIETKATVCGMAFVFQIIQNTFHLKSVKSVIFLK